MYINFNNYIHNVHCTCALYVEIMYMYSTCTCNSATTVHVHVHVHASNYTMYFRLSGVTEMEQVEEEETKLDPALSLTEEDVGQFVPVGPASGPDVVPRLLQGVRVVKGPDWKWGDQVRSFPSSLLCIFSIFFSFLSPLFPSLSSSPSSLPSLSPNSSLL